MDLAAAAFARFQSLPGRLFLLGIVFAALAAPWMLVAPVYTTLLARLTAPFLPGDTVIHSSGTDIFFTNSGYAFLSVVIKVVDSLLLMVGLALLTPLILLTPAMSWTARGYGLLGLFMIMVAANVLLLIIFGWSFHRNVTPSGQVTLDGVRAMIPLVYIALPTLLGGAWAWRFWLPYYDVSLRRGD